MRLGRELVKLSGAAVAITLSWDSKFEIGHERIDFEHRIFLGLIRELSLEVERGVGVERPQRILKEISKYAEFHFVSEENLMVDIGYPDLAEHRCQHLMLLEQLREQVQAVRSGERHLRDVALFLFDWFALHTTQVDRKIAEFLGIGR